VPQYVLYRYDASGACIDAGTFTAETLGDARLKAAARLPSVERVEVWAGDECLFVLRRDEPRRPGSSSDGPQP
jgi:hypothetical protein